MGIKLIREDLKFFGKTVIEKNMIKIIVLYNGDKLTSDAQCALRRCIEIYSKNTRFIIIINNKELLLNHYYHVFVKFIFHQHIIIIKKITTNLLWSKHKILRQLSKATIIYY